MKETNLTKSISLYGLATIARSMTSIIMLPIYMRYLSPSDYGILELLGMMLDITIIVIGSKLTPALIRFYTTAHTPKQRSQVIYGSLTVGTGLNLIGAIALISLAPYLSKLIFGNTDYTHLIQLYSVTLLTTVVTELGFGVLRAKEKASIYLAISLVKLATQVSLNLIFLIYLDMGVEGVIWGALFTGLSVSLMLFAYILQQHRPALSLASISSLIGFSLPIAIAGLADFYIVFGDRYFLQTFSGLTEVGLYAVAYKFGFILVTLSWSPFAQAWEPKAYKAAIADEPPSYFHNYFLLSLTFVGICATGIALFAREILQIIASEAFYSAAALIPPIVLAYTIKCIGEFCKLGFMVKGKTIQQFYAMFFAAIISTVCFLTLIPKYGAEGAAWSAVLSLSAKSLWEYFAGRKYFDMQLPWRPIVFLSIFSVTTVVCGNYWLMNSNLLQSIVMKALLFFSFLACIWFLSGFPTSAKSVVIQFFRKILGIPL